MSLFINQYNIECLVLSFNSYIFAFLWNKDGHIKIWYFDWITDDVRKCGIKSTQSIEQSQQTMICDTTKQILKINFSFHLINFTI